MSTEQETGPEDAPAESEAQLSALLPEPVRARVVALAADALGKVPAEQLPASLRRVASFAPVRRARLAATQIAAALETYPEFRARVARQVRVGAPEISRALDNGTLPAAADPVEVSALAYLLRPAGWVDTVRDSAELPPTAPNVGDDAVLERVRRQLEQARGDAHDQRERSRERLTRVKTENAELRRRLSDVRRQLREAQAAAEQALAEREEAQTAKGRFEVEARRARARIAELEEATAASRRGTRDEREYASMRTRLLLDTLLESAQGLRRELALPPLAGLPADTVTGAVANIDDPAGGPARGVGPALAPDDPALLEELLGLPRAHMIIDGYNVTKTAWPTTPLAEQRSRLLNGMAAVAARKRVEVTVVFDGADLAAPPPVTPPRGVRVMFSPADVVADDLIRELVTAEPTGRPIIVVSSDREVADGVARSGARPVASVALVRLLARS